MHSSEAWPGGGRPGEAWGGLGRGGGSPQDFKAVKKKNVCCWYIGKGRGGEEGCSIRQLFLQGRRDESQKQKMQNKDKNRRKDGILQMRIRAGGGG